MIYQPKKRITFILRNPGYFRNIEWIISHLIENSEILVKVVIGGVEKNSKKNATRRAAYEILVSRYPLIEFDYNYPRNELSWRLSNLKRLSDYLFFLNPDFPENSPAKFRAMSQMSKLESRVANFLERSSHGSLRQTTLEILVSNFRHEKSLPKLEKYINHLNTDYLAIIPAVADANSLLLAAAAKKTKTQSIGIVASWDNLTIKGQYIDLYDKTLFWSEGQISELIKFHGIEFDERRHGFFGCYPFAHRIIDKVIENRGSEKIRTLTWFMSSGFIGTNQRDLRAISKANTEITSETELLAKFLNEISKRKSLLYLWQVIIRPHPQQTEDSENLKPLLDEVADLGLMDLVRFDFSGEPVGESNRTQYSTLLEKTYVGVGLATTALFELGLMGKNVLAPPGTLANRSFDQLVHGGYLLERNGGPVQKTRNWEDFFSLLFASKSFTPAGQFKGMTLPTCDSDTLSNIQSFILEENYLRSPVEKKSVDSNFQIYVWQLLGSSMIAYYGLRRLRLRIIFKFKIIIAKPKKKVRNNFRRFLKVIKYVLLRLLKLLKTNQ
jgi:hypothetical protein